MRRLVAPALGVLICLASVRARAQIAVPSLDLALHAGGTFGGGTAGDAYSGDAAGAVQVFGGAASAQFDAGTHAPIDDADVEVPGPYRELSLAYTRPGADLAGLAIGGRAWTLATGTSWAGGVARQATDLPVPPGARPWSTIAAYGVLHAGGLVLRSRREDGAPPLLLSTLAYDRRVHGGDALERLALLDASGLPLAGGRRSGVPGLYLDATLGLDHASWATRAGCCLSGPDGAAALDARLGHAEVVLAAGRTLAADTAPDALAVEDRVWLGARWTPGGAWPSVSAVAVAGRSEYPALGERSTRSAVAVASLVAPLAHGAVLGVEALGGTSSAFVAGAPPRDGSLADPRLGFEALVYLGIDLRHGPLASVLEIPDLQGGRDLGALATFDRGR